MVILQNVSPKQFPDREAATADISHRVVFGSRTLHRHFVSIDESDHLDKARVAGESARPTFTAVAGLVQREGRERSSVMPALH